MPAEDPVCARAGMLPKELHRPTAAAVAIATARDAGFIGRILLGVLATIIWDGYEQISVPPAWDQAVGQAMAATIDGQLKSRSTYGQRVCESEAGPQKARECGSTGARTMLAKVTVHAIRQGM